MEADLDTQLQMEIAAAQTNANQQESDTGSFIRNLLSGLIAKVNSVPSAVGLA